MNRNLCYCLISLFLVAFLFNACRQNENTRFHYDEYKTSSMDEETEDVETDDTEENAKDYYNYRDDVDAGLLSLGVGVVIEREKPVFFSHDLAAFALAGPVAEVRYDSLILKYDEKGLLDFFGFNDSINLLHNIVYADHGYSHYLKEWGDNGWKFEIRGQNSFDLKKEHPIYDFLIHYPEGGYDRYIVDFKMRKDYDFVKKGIGGKSLKKYLRQDANLVEYRNFRRKGEFPQPDKFRYSDYKYDEWGNWIERTVKSEHQRTKYEKRDISYSSLK